MMGRRDVEWLRKQNMLLPLKRRRISKMDNKILNKNSYINYTKKFKSHAFIYNHWKVGTIFHLFIISVLIWLKIKAWGAHSKYFYVIVYNNLLLLSRTYSNSSFYFCPYPPFHTLMYLVPSKSSFSSSNL